MKFWFWNSHLKSFTSFETPCICIRSLGSSFLSNMNQYNAAIVVRRVTQNSLLFWGIIDPRGQENFLPKKMGTPKHWNEYIRVEMSLVPSFVTLHNLKFNDFWNLVVQVGVWQSATKGVEIPVLRYTQDTQVESMNNMRTVWHNVAKSPRTFLISFGYLESLQWHCLSADVRRT